MKSRNPIPSALARKFLLSFLREDLAEDVLGDLDEKFFLDLKMKGLARARIRYWYQVLQYMRPFAIRKLKPQPLKEAAMFRNYFKIGYRNLLRNKGYSAINIGGLAVGLAAAMLIGLWIYDELSFNKYHRGYERVSKVMHRFTRNGEVGVGDAIPLPLYTALAESYKDDFKYLVVCSWTDQHILSHEEKSISQVGNFMSTVAPSFLDLGPLTASSNH
jgi:putative ABC transport system permease protein